MTPLLELAEITKRFGKVTALSEASLRVLGGSVHALLGENGAGKSTLMHIAFGLVRADAGVIRVDGHARVWQSPVEAIAHGIGMVHQHFTLVPAMTVAENIALGGRGRFHPARAIAAAERLMRETGLAVDPQAPVAQLSVGLQQRVEILKALARDARVLILDEPTAVLAPHEVQELLRWIRGFLRPDRAVVLITHKLAESLAIADEVTVLRSGRTVLQRPRSEISADVLVEAMLGQRLHELASSAPRSAGSVALALRKVVGPRGLGERDPVSIEVRRGEVLGIAAVEGAGQGELLRLFTGHVSPRLGSAELAANIAFIPEDRHRDAGMMGFTLVENLALKGAGQRSGLVDWKSLAARTRELLLRFDVRAEGPQSHLGSLSGGNQQKWIVARELSAAPDAVVAENPTRGLDVRATQAVRELLRATCAEGAAVVVYSSDLDEVLALSDRIAVVHSGSVREVVRDRDVVGRAMLGAFA